MNDEVWRDIEGYEGYYQVSNFGNVKSLARSRTTGKVGFLSERVLKKYINSDGYYLVKLYKNGSKVSFKVHSLVANTFCSGRTNTSQVNHKDGNKTNNHFKNLEHVSMSENVRHAYKNGLNPWKKYFFDQCKLDDDIKKGVSVREIAQSMSCSISVVRYYIKKGKNNESDCVVR